MRAPARALGPVRAPAPGAIRAPAVVDGGTPKVVLETDTATRARQPGVAGTRLAAEAGPHSSSHLGGCWNWGSRLGTDCSFLASTYLEAGRGRCPKFGAGLDHPSGTLDMEVSL